ncbi:hypothetical protein E9529_06155 [Blastococcus sp. KM273128]|uniref:hypothetical protein n=1 Tax=Blastococcus sp. KM273128 TaxID=2570314 RepID=UPI001F482A31|nr:hypothetical protein [Blastococcus sp. KM273128]MCF6743862.1 hypothetical protein [Blastococcus sp. KM273128]
MSDQPGNPYEAARERLRRQDREELVAYGQRPFGPFLARVAVAALIAGLVMHLLFGWISGVIMFLGWLLPALSVRMWSRTRAGTDDHGSRRE